MAKPDWITVNPSSGEGTGNFNITFAKNTSTFVRSGIITVKTISGLTNEIQVNQAGKAENFIQGSGGLCTISIPTNVFPYSQSGVSFHAQIVLSNGTKVEAGDVDIFNNEHSKPVGSLDLDSEKLPVRELAKITSIQVKCSPLDNPTNYFDHCIGQLSYNSGIIAFGVVGSSTVYSASFEQFTNSIWGFKLSVPIPILGDTTLVYNGDSSDVPRIVINELF